MVSINDGGEDDELGTTMLCSIAIDDDDDDDEVVVVVVVDVIINECINVGVIDAILLLLCCFQQGCFEIIYISLEWTTTCACVSFIGISSRRV